MDGNGNVGSVLYDGTGNALVSTDALERVTTDEYNGFSEVVAAVDAMGNETTNVYNSTGDETSSTDPLGNATSWSYGSGAPAGSPHTMTNALTGVTTYGYDSAGDVTSTTDPDSDVTSSVFDAVGELCASLSANGYAAGDRIPSSCPSAGAAYLTAYPSYDFFGQVLKKITPANAAGGAWTYGYDADGNETSVENPDSQTTSETFDAGDEQASEVLPAVSGTSPTTTYAYDPGANKVTTTKPLGNVTTDYYDAGNNELAYTNPEGNPATCNPLTTSNCACAWYFAFDTANRMTSQTTPPTAGSSTGETTSYADDADGNQKTLTDPLGQVTTRSYDGLMSSTVLVVEMSLSRAPSS